MNTADKSTAFGRRLDELEEGVREQLTPDLLKPPWRNTPRMGRHPMAGHCYVASEVAFHLLGGATAGWTPQVVRHEGGTHWYLRHADGALLDITVAQFLTPVPYDRGRGCGFLTKAPSARAREVIRRLSGRL